MTAPRTGVYLATVFVLALLAFAPKADARPVRWNGPVAATWYGPGFYGNAFACSYRPDVPNRYTPRVRGAAHMWLPCGTKVTICHKPLPRRRNCVRIRVIDTGAFDPSTFDLTAQTSLDLGIGPRPYTFGTGGKPGITWKRGWA